MRYFFWRTWVKEKIGNPELFTGRKKELAIYLKWTEKEIETFDVKEIAQEYRELLGTYKKKYRELSGL
ncbi:MAG: hypothetical protein GY795_27805 [Desulfobacterales bacterium]|nr:hypothetical protein [Desulfobacterales bacterium]